ncbi:MULTISPECIES: hypothetical protein [Thiorhodovibrio]|nr:MULTISPECIES: hypothetical protein [Thiorhodovibrio]
MSFTVTTFVATALVQGSQQHARGDFDSELSTHGVAASGYPGGTFSR